MATATRKTTPNPTKADIVRIIIAKALKEAETRRDNFRSTSPAPSQVNASNLARLNGEVTALTSLRTRVLDYLDNGKLPLE